MKHLPPRDIADWEALQAGCTYCLLNDIMIAALHHGGSGVIRLIDHEGTPLKQCLYITTERDWDGTVRTNMDAEKYKGFTKLKFHMDQQSFIHLNTNGMVEIRGHDTWIRILLSYKWADFMTYECVNCNSGNLEFTDVVEANCLSCGLKGQRPRSRPA